jgi:diguanylate cyclase (GGDEF)-like protein
MDSQAKNSKDSVAGSTNAEELRAQRVWRLSRVAWCTWLFFWGYFLWRDHLPGMLICAIEVLCITLVLEHNRARKQYRLAMNYTLGACACGIFSVSISDPSLQPTMLFFPVSILIASQLLGVKEAFLWLIVNLFAQTVFYLAIFQLDLLALAGSLDEIVMVYGVAVCTFFCCQQGEAFYRERTRGLVNLSNQLQEKGERLQKLASTDSLTGLMNRYQFLLELRERALQASRHGHRLALLTVDMDGFKEINDTLGHPIGDRALAEVAGRLTAVASDEAIIARLGGDEFCLIIEGCDTIDKANRIARDIREALRQPYMMESMECQMDSSLGIALCPDHTKCPTELLAFADTAMFCAKSKRVGIEVYDSEMTRQLIENRMIQNKLMRALERKEFFLVYQPQVCLKTGKTIAVEALLRWKHEGEIIPPIAFISLLEKTRDIIPVGSWVIREACDQLRRWHDAGLDIGVAINLSSVQFNDKFFAQNVISPLLELGVLASKIDLEITESLLVDEVEVTNARLCQLRETGVSISIDDFGTGYSSLAYLKQFPLDRLKIDRAFVKGIPEEDDGLIAKSITVLAHSLGLKVLAEGVETQTQLEFLDSIGCDEYQGYFMSPPVSAEKITQFLEEPFPVANAGTGLQAPSVSNLQAMLSPNA